MGLSSEPPSLFLRNTSTNNSSEQLSRQAAWDISMYAVKERNEKRCFFVEVFKSMEKTRWFRTLLKPN